MEEGEGLDFSVEHWWLLPLPGQPGVQLHAGCGEPLLADRGDVDAAHLKLELTQLEEQGWLQSQASPWFCHQQLRQTRWLVRQPSRFC